MSKSNAVEVRSGFPFNYDQERASVESGLACRDKSLTRQSEAEGTDINVLVKRFGITGQMPIPTRLPSFQDFEGIFDFRSAMDAINAARASFMELPAQVRARFGHDPAEFVTFCSDPGNLEELRKMGLAPPAEPDPLVKEVEREEAKDKIRASRKPAAPHEAGDKK